MSQVSLFDTQTISGPLTLMTVCTGNICRSPLAEGLLRQTLQGLPIGVRSAGTAALIGEQMTEPNRKIAAELGVTDASVHRARLLTAEDVHSSDLVLALTRDHRRAIVELVPRASRRTFTLREFARLAESVDLSEIDTSVGMTVEECIREFIELTAQVRGTLPPLADPSEDDVVDPFRQSNDVYALSASQIVPAVNAVSRLLRRAAVLGRPDG